MGNLQEHRDLLTVWENASYKTKALVFEGNSVSFIQDLLRALRQAQRVRLPHRPAAGHGENNTGVFQSSEGIANI